MKTSDYLDDDRIERLADLLERHAVPFRGFNLEALDGYLSALAVGPGEDMSNGEWMAPIWGKQPPHWADEREREEAEALLLAHRDMAAARVRHGEDIPDSLAPLLWLPEDPEAGLPQDVTEEELDVGRDWALGFFTAVSLREDGWDQWLDEFEWMSFVFDRLDRLASGEALADDPTAPATPIGYRERLEIIASLPAMLADLHGHSIDVMTPR